MVDLRVQAEVENVVRERLRRARPEIEASLAHIAQGNPLAAETTIPRRLERLQAKTGGSRAEAALLSAAIDMAGAGLATTRSKQPGPEAIRGTTLDFVGVAFLERGRRAADAVGRVAHLNGGPQGTGFLVAPNLFLTNHHVIETPAAAARLQVQFDYEHDRLGRVRAVSGFLFDPERCFVTDGIEGLDYTLIGVGPRREGSRALAEFGFIPLSEATDKHMLGEIANLIQHPDGRFKELVLRENHLVARDETRQVLHYVADTEQGSSGAPVFNNEWEPIALHHWGGPWREVMDSAGRPLAREINEGIRISAIVRDLRARAEAAAVDAAAIREALAAWDAAGRSPGPMSPAGPPVADAPVPPAPVSRHGDGSVTWTLPIEITLRAPWLAGAAAPVPPPGGAEAGTWRSEDFADRGGYEPGFIPGHIVPLPGTDALPWRLARNQLAAAGDDPHELRYHHFSILMNADRRLACCTAVNIDGARIRAVNRDDKTVIADPTLAQLGIESAEASDDFRPDRRILPEEQMNRPFYADQVVPGFPDPSSAGRIARMFQKGHIILRGDPAWGSEAEARAAERDTFFYTNAAPQVGFFNQGSALDRPGAKGKLRWRAVETYVLRNAVTMRQRISVFAGPIFDDAADPVYRFGARVPMRFWKIAVWNDGTALRAIALIADQRPVLEVMPEAIGAEAFQDEEELARVSEFLSTVREVEALTHLEFPAALRDGDVRAGAADPVPALTLQPAALAGGVPPPRRKGRKASKRS
ncbi:DNA/RNA non-specific endonuclease [Paracoccus binzhouensis]|uniref:DNA/RNA non-specific endonuclease n=1 Tax=Paracoccus binzhouensis TaxID=2796149 RepID=UPI0018EEF297|nr:DNA/RNA non-specific endonuclease [Paracoccus binzhouensis]